MGFGGEVGDRLHLFFGEQAIEEGAIANIALDKPQIGLACFQIRQAAAIARIGEGIQHNHAAARILPAPVLYKIGADKACAARDQQRLGEVICHGGERERLGQLKIEPVKVGPVKIEVTQSTPSLSSIQSPVNSMVLSSPTINRSALGRRAAAFSVTRSPIKLSTMRW